MTLTAPPGFPNYLWSTGATSQSISVGGAGTYWGQASYPTGEMVVNGNFSSGNTGFTTPFNYSSALVNDGNYFIGNNAATYHANWLGTGTGPFMIVNAGWMHAGSAVWCETFTVCPNQTYNLSVRLMSLSNQGPPALDWSVDGSQLGNWNQTTGQGVWTTFTNTWTSGPTQTSAAICLVVASGHGVGNDIGIDNVSIQGTINLRDDVNVSVTPLPVFDLGPNATLCTGQNLVLDAAVPGGSYLWQDGATTPGYVVSGPGNYSVTVTANSCPRTDNITVNYNARPVVDLGPDLTLCTGQTTVLNAATPGATYVWQDGSTNPTFTVTGPGTYSVQVTRNNCSASDVIDIAYNTTPTIDLGPDQTICAGASAVLDATTPGATYAWNDGSTGPTLTTSTAGTYDVTITVNGCSASDQADVIVTPLPAVDLGPDQTVCPGTTVVLDATLAGASYVWQDASTLPTFSATTPGNYDVQVIANGCSNTDSFTLSHFTLQTVDLGPDVTICQGQATAIGTTVPSATYTWNTGASTPTIGVSANGTYWLDVTLNGCVVRDSIDVIVTPLPVFDLGVDQTICPGTMVTLDATTPSATYTWNNGDHTAAINVGPGAYDVTVTANGCDATDNITVNAWPAPSVDLGADATLCPGTPLLLDATQAGASYLWQDGSTNATLNVTTDGTYNVDLTDLHGCLATDAITVTYATPASIDLGPDVTICQGTTITLDATTPGATYAWSTGATTPTITVGTANNYSVVVTQGSCTVNDAIAVQVAAVPTVDPGVDVTLCPGEDIVLDATGPGLTYAWSTGATTPTITVTAGGTYDVTVTNAANCSATDAIDVTYATPGAVDLGPDMVLCQGESTTLDATLPGSTYAWSNGAITPTITVNATGTYSVTVTQGSCTVTDDVDVTVNPMPQVDLGNDATLCAGEDIVLDATWPGATYAWSTGASTPTITATTTGTYSVDVDLNGCIATDAIDITVLSATSVDLGADQVICQGQQVVLDATTPGSTYLWSTGATTPTITVTTSGTYSVTVSTGQCSVSDQVDVTVNPMPQVDLGNDATLCAGEDIVLDATWPGATYAWSTGASTPTITATTTGTYSVDVDLNGCIATDAIDITVLSATSVDLGADQVICQGQQVVLDATTPGSTYLWSTGATTPTITVTTSGTYSVTVSTGQCSVSDQVDVTVNPMPQVDLGNDATLCAGEDIVLDATWPGATYAWSTGASTPTITATTTGTYSVDVDLNGCIATDAIDITVLSATSVDLGADQVICQGQQVVLDATTPGSTYLWSTGATTPTITVTTSGTYSVTVSTGQCSVSDQVDVTVNPMPQVGLGNDATLCAGEDIVLDATWPGATYAWSTGASTPTITATTTGTYSVDVDLNGCIATDAIDITVLSATSVDLGADQVICQGQQVVLDATTPGSTYLWSTGATTPTITVTTSGTYSVTVSTGQCSVSDQVDVTVNPMPQVGLGNDATLCAGEDIVLDATWPGATYAWSTGASTPTITATTTGTYSVDVDLNGCIATDAIDITVLSATSVDLGADQVICQGEQVVLDATTPGSTYLWSTGETTPTITVTTSGTYSVTVSTGQCSVSDQVDVTVNPTAQIDLGPDLIFCEGETNATLDATWPGATYLWSTGATTPTIDVSSGGAYSVDVDLNGCTVSDEVSITFGSFSYSLGNDTTLCPGEELVLGGDLPDGTAVWNDEEEAATFTVSEAGAYWIHFTSVSGCEVRDTINVAYQNIGTLDLGADITLCEGDEAILDATLAGATIVWDNGSTDPIRTVTATGEYSVEATIAQCTISDEINVTFNPLPDLALGADVELCPGESITLDATTTGATYQWQNGTTSPTFSTSAAGTVNVEVTVDGCSSTDEVVVTLLQGPSPSLGNDTTICAGADLHLLVGETETTYFWDDGSQDLQRVIGNEGYYWVDATRNTCTTRDSIYVNILSADDIDLGDDRTICSGASTELDGTYPGASYAWNTGATTPTINVNAGGEYSLTIMLSACSVTDAVLVDVLTLQAPDPGPDRSICEGESIELSIDPTTAHVTWSTGDEGVSTTVSEAGTYTVTLDSLGCTASSTIAVRTTAMITEIDLGPDRTLCNGVMDLLQAPNIPGATYTWSTGATGGWLSIDRPGTYGVHATGRCIDARATIVVEPADCGTYVFVPNAFTPNGDDDNDIFLPSIAGPVDQFQLDIFDRWGERIHTTTDRNAGWDGTYNGVGSQDGVYVWTLNYRVLGPEGVKSERLIGHVTLLR